MHTYKTIYATCQCGELNSVYQASTVHKRITWCRICKSLSVKTGMNHRERSERYLFAEEWDQESFRKFAIAWG